MDTTLIPTRLRQPWMFTQVEIVDALYNALKDSLRKGSRVPVRTKDGLEVLNSPLQVMRDADGAIMIRAGGRWTPIDRDVLDAWAQTLGLTGPTQHFLAVERAIKDEYPVEKHIIVEYAALAGMDRKSRRAAKKEQTTRTVSAPGTVICLDKLDHPCPAESALWNSKEHIIASVDSYRKFDNQWVVHLDNLEGQYVISRINGPERQWRVSFKAVFSEKGEMNTKTNITTSIASVNPGEFVTVDSGEREEFETGSKRDTQQGKPRYDLIPVGALERLAMLYARGAEKYGERNFEKGQPMRRIFGSMLRHAFAWAKGDREEDHLAAVAWNAFALMHHEDAIAAGLLPETLADMPDLPQQQSRQ